MAVIALPSSHARLSNSPYLLCFENNSRRQVRIGDVVPALTEQRVEFVVVIFAHRILTR